MADGLSFVYNTNDETYCRNQDLYFSSPGDAFDSIILSVCGISKTLSSSAERLLG